MTNNPQTAVYKLLEHFGIAWRGLSEATITVSGADQSCVTIKTTRCIHNDEGTLTEFDNKTYKITEI